jgi:hypothetical protein
VPVKRGKAGQVGWEPSVLILAIYVLHTITASRQGINMVMAYRPFRSRAESKLDTNYYGGYGTWTKANSVGGKPLTLL